MYVVIEGIPGSGVTSVRDALALDENGMNRPGFCRSLGTADPPKHPPLLGAVAQIVWRSNVSRKLAYQMESPDHVVVEELGLLRMLADQGSWLRDPLFLLPNPFDVLLDLELGWVREIGGRIPDLILFLSCDPALAGKRTTEDPSVLTRLDSGYTEALYRLRSKLGQDWMKEHVEIVSTCRPGPRSESVAVPLEEVVARCRAAIESRFPAAAPAAGGAP